MVIRLMTLATVLMLLACLMIGASIAWANPAKAFEATTTIPTAPRDTITPSPPLAASDPTDQFGFDSLAGKTIRTEDEALPYAAISSC